jgi:hypothetical protein
VNFYTLVIITGAAARLTRLTTRDRIIAGLRAFVHQRVLFHPTQRAARAAGQPLPTPPRPRAAVFRTWIYALITCDWCVGVWWCAIVGVLAYLSGGSPWFTVPATILTAAYLLGWVVEHEQPLAPLQQPNRRDANT